MSVVFTPLVSTVPQFNWFQHFFRKTGQISDSSANSFTVDSPRVSMTFTGTSFTYDSDGLSTGTITGATVTIDGVASLGMSFFAITAADFMGIFDVRPFKRDGAFEKLLGEGTILLPTTAVTETDSTTQPLIYFGSNQNDTFNISANFALFFLGEGEDDLSFSPNNGSGLGVVDYSSFGTTSGIFVNLKQQSNNVLDPFGDFDTITGINYIVGTSAQDFMSGAGGDDTFDGLGGRDVLSGGKGNDVLWGGRGRDVLFGGGNDDYMEGNNGRDKLYGGGGNDNIRGGSGSDLLVGGKGDDFLHGGAGIDRFVFRDSANDSNGNDVILDFSATDDLIDLRGQGYTLSTSGFSALITTGTNESILVQLASELDVENAIINGINNSVV